jgi:YVTN family beta-propeller protein
VPAHRPSTLLKIGSIPVGQGPHNVQVSPDGKWVWVTNNGEPSMAAEKMPTGKMPQGEHAAMGGAGAVWIIDTTGDTVVAKVPVGKHPAHVVVSGDGSTAYITNGTDNTVSVVDTATQRVSDVVVVGVSPHGLRISPDGKEVWVANLKAGTVSVIDTASRKQVAEIAVGKGPAQMGFTPDGRFAFVSLSQENQVAVIDPMSRKVLRKLGVGTVPIQLYATPDSTLVVVANQGTPKKPGSTVSVIDLASMKVAATIKTGAGAHGVVIDRDGRHAFVTNTFANTVSVIDVAKRKVVATVPVGKGPNGISVSP